MNSAERSDRELREAPLFRVQTDSIDDPADTAVPAPGGIESQAEPRGFPFYVTNGVGRKLVERW
jgi:hypothetical protein